MGPTLTYFRLHRWQRRLLSILVAVALGLGGAVVLRPVFREYYLVRDLGSRDLAVRNVAINRAAVLARQYPHVLDRLNRELGAADDVKFQAITRVLEFLDVFRVPGRDPNQLDRLRLIEFTLTRADVSAARVTIATSRGATSRSATTSAAATSTSSPLAATQATATAASRAAARSAIAAETRLFLFQDAVLTGRDNVYNRRLLAAAARDESPTVRQAAAVLAARFADANTLLQLLRDPDPNVVEWAAIDGALGAISQLTPELVRLVDTAEATNLLSGCVYALAKSSPPTSGLFGDERLRRVRRLCSADRLLHVLIATDDRPQWSGVLSASSGYDAPFPSAMAIRAQGRFKPPWGDHAIERILEHALDPNGPTQKQVLAALESGDRLDLPNLPIRREAEAILRRFWHPDLTLVLIAAARVVGRQADSPQIKVPDVPTPLECVETLRRAALFDAGSDANAPEFALAVPAAAAAVALWLREPSASFLVPAPGGAGEDANSTAAAVDPNSTAYLIYHTSSSEHQLAGDYIAWHLSRAEGSAQAKAFQLGMNLLPPAADPRDANTRRGFRNYSAPSRATAAMLLALAARTPQEKEQAKARIASRLEGGPLRAPSDFYEVSTYKCALLILGDNRYRAEVAALLDSGAFPVRRAITALCAAGDRRGLDWLLWDLRAGTAEIGEIIIGTRLGEVLASLVPELPAVDEAAGDDLRNWQVRILQDYYRIHREKIRFVPAN